MLHLPQAQFRIRARLLITGVVSLFLLVGATAVYSLKEALMPSRQYVVSGFPRVPAGIFIPPKQDQGGIEPTGAQITMTSTPQPSQTKTTNAANSAPHLGIYESFPPHDPQSLDRLQEIRRAGFDTVLNYDILDGSQTDINRYLDKAQSLGIKVIFSIKDFYDLEKSPDIHLTDFATYGSTNDQIAVGIVRAFKNHPAIYGWYISDERPDSPDNATQWQPVLLKRYQQVKAEDPYHPTIITLGCYQGPNVSGWDSSLPSVAIATDELAFDSYPVPYAPLDIVGQCSHTLSQVIPSPANRWFVVQAFSWASYPDTVKSDQEDLTKARYPTVDELTAMVKSARQNGVQNLMFYSYFDLKNDPANFNRSWSNIQQAIHNAEMTKD